MKNELPAVTVGNAPTLVISYEDGSVLRIPYFDRAGAEAFLALETGVAEFNVESYKGE